MQPTITHFDDGNGEEEHVYVGRNLTFQSNDRRSVTARIYDDEPDVAFLVNVSHRQAGSPMVESVVAWLRGSQGIRNVKVLGREGGYISLNADGE